MYCKQLLLQITLTLSLVPQVKGQAAGKLNFQTSEFASEAGSASVFLYRASDKIPGSPYKRGAAQIHSGSALVSFNDVPFGDYAAILLHDENNNGKIDHWLGLPDEPLGYSNNWTLGIFTGMPTFQKLKFTHNSSDGQHEIKLTYKTKHNK